MLFSATWWLTIPIVLLGATISAMSGFGFAIVTTPLMLLLYPPKVAVPMVLLVSSYGVALQAWSNRHQADRRLAGGLFLASLLGMPVGLLILAVVSGDLLRLIIGCSTLVGVLITLRRGQAPDGPVQAPSLPVVGGTGFLSGILATATSQSGIPIVLLMAWTGMEKQRVRATTFVYFALSATTGVALHLGYGNLTLQAAGAALALAPAYLGGMLIGNAIFRRISQTAFRRLVLAVLSLAATAGLVTGISALIHLG
ncbi:MAG: sulfite exporter TauE/SafE family protein [Bacillota bacterium]